MGVKVVHSIGLARSQTHREHAGTADFLTGLMQQHEEMAWMLRSFIEGEALEAGGNRNISVKTPAKA